MTVDLEVVCTEAQEKARESRLRSRVRGRGFVLRKSRCRNPDVFEYGLFRIDDPYCNCVLVGASPCDHSMTLDEVEDWLDQIAEEKEG